MKLIKNEKGQSMVETALVLPIVLLLLLGIFDFGWLFYNKLGVENCTRDAARFAAVVYDVTSGDTEETSKTNIKGYVKGLKPGLKDEDITIVPVDYGTNKKAFIKVTVKTDVKTLTPLIGAFFDEGTCHLVSECTMRREKPEPSTTAAP